MSRFRYAKTVKTVASSSAIRELGLDIYKQAKSILRSAIISVKRTYLSNFDVAVVSKYFKRLLVGVDLSGGFREDSSAYYDEHNYDVIRYKGTIIVAKCYPYRHGQFGGGELILTVLATKKNIKNRDKFVKLLEAESNKYRDTLPTGVCYRYERCQWLRVTGIKRRTFENTFIGSAEKEKIFKGIDSFIARRSWYDKHNLSYHYGILLYGPPGTGKSTLIQAISNKYGVAPYIINNDIADGIKAFRKEAIIGDCDNRLKIIVVEDIDVCAFASARDISEMSRKLDEERQKQPLGSMEFREKERTMEKIIYDRRTMSTVLNDMDGLDALQNVIYIFTTNNVGAIDPAIKRAGRLDTIVEIGYATDETMNEFCKYHFDSELPKDRQIKPKQIFATMQLDVMQGYTFEQIVAKYTNPLY